MVVSKTSLTRFTICGCLNNAQVTSSMHVRYAYSGKTGQSPTPSSAAQTAREMAGGPRDQGICAHFMSE